MQETIGISAHAHHSIEASMGDAVQVDQAIVSEILEVAGEPHLRRILGHPRQGPPLGDAERATEQQGLGVSQCGVGLVRWLQQCRENRVPLELTVERVSAPLRDYARCEVRRCAGKGGRQIRDGIAAAGIGETEEEPRAIGDPHQQHEDRREVAQRLELRIDAEQLEHPIHVRPLVLVRDEIA